MKNEETPKIIARYELDRDRLAAPSLSIIAWSILALVVMGQICAGQAKQKQQREMPQYPKCAQTGRDLIKIPEITKEDCSKLPPPQKAECEKRAHILEGVIITSDEKRYLWGFKDATQNPYCASQYVRYYKGYRLGHPEDWDNPVSKFKVDGVPEPIPGPTIRAHVGDLVELRFLNEIDTKHFPKSLDSAEKGEGCDKSPNGDYPGSDILPNCIHGSSTSNIHFHGTHTTPSTTGDNVLLQIRPSTRTYPPEPDGTLDVNEKTIAKPFNEFYKWCEEKGSPTQWAQLPEDFRHQQMGPWKADGKELPHGWIGKYDASPGYSRAPLWEPNDTVIKKGGWPQYYIGAFPFCFLLPKYVPPLLGGKPKYAMGQAPGTHWYHAHKHGSTDINVSNGMTGALIIEGDYDDQLKAFYKSDEHKTNWGLDEVVLVIQQLGTFPSLIVGGGPNTLSVNGRSLPQVTMRPHQMQMWRIVNTASRNTVTLCPLPAGSGINYRQIAQDGVQFKWENYDKDKNNNGTINIAPGNRVDLLVQASAATTSPQPLNVSTAVSNGTCPGKTALLTVNVDGSKPAANPQMPFFEEKDKDLFPVFPVFLNDIRDEEIKVHRELVFNSVPNPNPEPPPLPRPSPPSNSHYINNKQFTDEHVDQAMLLDTAEEWKVINITTPSGVGNIWHPFHIHVNPFQVTEVFNPNSADAKKGGKCYADPNKPETWKPCPPEVKYPPPKDFIWWDVFAIPAGRQDTLTCTTKDQCPEEIRDRVRCPGGGKECTIIIPGYFKMRTRFSDFTGQYVLHCHILAHEDRGMMELVEVVPNTTIYSHH